MNGKLKARFSSTLDAPCERSFSRHKKQATTMEQHTKINPPENRCHATRTKQQHSTSTPESILWSIGPPWRLPPGQHANNVKDTTTTSLTRLENHGSALTKSLNCKWKARKIRTKVLQNPTTERRLRLQQSYWLLCMHRSSKKTQPRPLWSLPRRLHSARLSCYTRSEGEKIRLEMKRQRSIK